MVLALDFNETKSEPKPLVGAVEQIMQRWRSNLSLKATGVGVAAFLVGLLISRLFLRNDQVPFPGMSLAAFRGMNQDCHPVWYSLSVGQIHAGQSVDDVIRKTSPPTVMRHGVYTTIGYEDRREGIPFTGITLIARQDRLVSARAWSCTWNHTFFGEMTRDEWGEWDRSLKESKPRRGEVAEQEGRK